MSPDGHSVQGVLELMKESDMQMFGGTCPMCCGDVRQADTGVCVLCGFTFGSDCSPKGRNRRTAALDGAKRILTKPTFVRGRLTRLPLGLGVKSRRQPILSDVLAPAAIAMVDRRTAQRGI